METITKPDFRGRIAKIVEEVSARTCIDDVDVEALKEILQEELNEYYYDDFGDGYYEGHPDGYALGYNEGYSNGYSAVGVTRQRSRQP